jgi:protoheme IX farnesyltransferase
MKAFFDLTKLGIGLFVVISGLIGYAVSYPLGQPIDMLEPILLMVGLYLLSSGSFAINQAQEWTLDKQMPRTAKRPVPRGVLSATQAYFLGTVMSLAGLAALALIDPVAALLGFLTVALYNGIYTLYWKKHLAFGAVPGAIPGAMPVVIGYAASGASIWQSDCVYLFLIMFLWQMPHFWALAIRYKDDYEKAGFPVLPVSRGTETTLSQIGLYTFAYVGVALAAPLFVSTHILHVLLVIPLALKVLFEFFRYFKSEAQTRWLPFFLWTNLSMLAFIVAPVLDKWVFYFIGQTS